MGEGKGKSGATGRGGGGGWFLLKIQGGGGLPAEGGEETLACRNGFGPLVSNGRQRVGAFKKKKLACRRYTFKHKRIQWNAGTACVSECVLKALACRGLRVGPSKLRSFLTFTIAFNSPPKNFSLSKMTSRKSLRKQSGKAIFSSEGTKSPRKVVYYFLPQGCFEWGLSDFF